MLRRLFDWLYGFGNCIMSKDTWTGRVSEKEMKKDWAELEEKVKQSQQEEESK